MEKDSNDKIIRELKKRANYLRIRIVENSAKASIPHLGSCLSCVDLLVALYFNKLKIYPNMPTSPERDRFILSKGHAAPALFHVLAMCGFYPESDLSNYGEDGGVFGEHPPSPKYLSGIEAATGSLGHGMPIGLGMALASRINNMNYSVYTLLGDGECNEGSIWESAMLASAQKVKNFCVLIDCNKWQGTDRTDVTMNTNLFKKKWEAFGWETIEIDGHNYYQILDSLSIFPNENKKPLAIIANTIKGKGISFMEDDNNWHYRIPTENEVKLAKKELGFL